MTIVYQPRMEILKKDMSVSDVWQDWGVYDSEEKAIEVAKEVQKEIDDGKYDDRKEWQGDGDVLQMCVEVIDEDKWNLIEIIEL